MQKVNLETKREIILLKKSEKDAVNSSHDDDRRPSASQLQTNNNSTTGGAFFFYFWERDLHQAADSPVAALSLPSINSASCSSQSGAVFIRRPPEQLAISLLLRISFLVSLFLFGRSIIHSTLQLKMNRYSFVALIVAVAMAAAASSNRQVVCFNNLFKFSRFLVIT
jgi:hypothetical protein